MGVTYRAWDTISARPVVVKVPNRSCMNDPVLVKRFDREIELLLNCSHPSTVPILDRGHFQHVPYVVMRFLPGGSLADRQGLNTLNESRPSSPSMLHCWLPKIALALDFLHKNNVVHRDVKPSNIFFDAFWNPFLGDFGLAKIDFYGEKNARGADLTATDVGLGTLAYASPEQLTRSKAVDSRADQYSLAVTVFEVLTGRKPFEGKETHIAVEIFQGSAPLLHTLTPGLPETLCESVERAMLRSRQGRYRTCTDFVTALLKDVPRQVVQKEVARLLCPACKKIIKLRLSAAGLTARCPKCKAPMTAAADLSAFWLVSEDPTQPLGVEFADLPEAIPDPFTDKKDDLLEAIVAEDDELSFAFKKEIDDRGRSLSPTHVDDYIDGNESLVGHEKYSIDDVVASLPSPRMSSGKQVSRSRKIVLRDRSRRPRQSDILSAAVIIFALSIIALLSVTLVSLLAQKNESIVIENFSDPSKSKVVFSAPLDGPERYLRVQGTNKVVGVVTLTIKKTNVPSLNREYSESTTINEQVLQYNGTEVQFIWGGTGSAEYSYEITDKDGESVFFMACKFPPEKKMEYGYEEKDVAVLYAPAE